MPGAGNPLFASDDDVGGLDPRVQCLGLFLWGGVTGDATTSCAPGRVQPTSNAWVWTKSCGAKCVERLSWTLGTMSAEPIFCPIIVDWNVKCIL